jgi:5-(carboxyamino)imidazole ribonucleotide mutase
MNNPRVAIVMGSDSDLPVMRPAAQALAELGIAHEIRVISAHRTPQATLDYATSAAERGLSVLIAGAGGAAHLPGMLAASTPLPVIGVPVPTTHLQGLDSLLSIVQMPAGIPVATVAIGGARNAALLAARILAISESAIANVVRQVQNDLAAKAHAADLHVTQIFTAPVDADCPEALISRPEDLPEAIAGDDSAGPSMVTKQDSTRDRLAQAFTTLANHGVEIRTAHNQSVNEARMSLRRQIIEHFPAADASYVFYYGHSEGYFDRHGNLQRGLTLYCSDENVAECLKVILLSSQLPYTGGNSASELKIQASGPS